MSIASRIAALKARIGTCTTPQGRSPAEKAVLTLRRWMTSRDQRMRLRSLYRELMPSAPDVTDDNITDLIPWLAAPALVVAAELVTRGDDRGLELMALRMQFVVRSDDADRRRALALAWREVLVRFPSAVDAIRAVSAASHAATRGRLR